MTFTQFWDFCIAMFIIGIGAWTIGTVMLVAIYINTWRHMRRAERKRS